MRCRFAGDHVHRLRGFTIIELMVVVGIIAILLSILLPTMSNWRFHTGVIECAHRFEHRGVAIINYAYGNKQRLPSPNIHRGVGRNPWDVSNSFAPTLAPYGMDTPKLWYCPLQHDPDFKTMDEVYAEQRSRFGNFTILSGTSYWVTRRDSSRWFPAVSNDPYHEDGWPRSLSDKRALNEPIWTDQCANPGGEGANIDMARGGHMINVRTDNINMLFLDGHVEYRHRDQMQVRWFGNWYSYY